MSPNNTLPHKSELEIKPFVVWELDESEAHLCPVRAFGHYIHATGITSGYLFRPFMTGDRISANDIALVCPPTIFPLFQRDS